jgi:DNA-nicking Smr family endonuclease
MKNKTPSPDDLSLWQQAMRDVKRLFGAAEPGGGPVISSEAPVKPTLRPARRPLPYTTIEPSYGLAPSPVPMSPPNPGIDRRTEDKFRKGKMAIDGRIDLHGMTLKEAHATVRDYILLQSAAGKRCLLIITGKGSGGGSLSDAPRGQIRQSLGHWLDAPDLRPLILSVAPAQRGHGGDGAFYVLLRRNRE